MQRRVMEPQHIGVEGLPRKLSGGGKGGGLGICFGSGSLARAAVGRIADQGMAEMREMHANLMRAPGFQATLHKGRKRAGAKSLDDPIARTGFLAAAAHDRHSLAVEGVASDPSLDRACSRTRRTPNHGMVGTLDRMMRELLREAGHRALVLRGHKQSAGVLIEAVNDTGPCNTADSFERRAAMRDKGVDERAGQIARSRVDDESARLLDHDEVGVFIHDRERNIFATRFGLDGRRQLDVVALALFDPVIGVSYRFSVLRNEAFLDQLLKARSAEAGEAGDQEAVEAPATFSVRDCRNLAGG